MGALLHLRGMLVAHSRRMRISSADVLGGFLLITLIVVSISARTESFAG